MLSHYQQGWIMAAISQDSIQQSRALPVKALPSGAPGNESKEWEVAGSSCSTNFLEPKSSGFCVAMILGESMGPEAIGVTDGDDNSMSVVANKLLTHGIRQWAKHTVNNLVSKYGAWTLVS